MTTLSKEKEDGDDFLIPGTLYTPIGHVVLLGPRGGDTQHVQAGEAMFFIGYANNQSWSHALHGYFLLRDGQLGYFGNKSPFGQSPQLYVTQLLSKK